MKEYLPLGLSGHLLAKCPFWLQTKQVAKGKSPGATLALHLAEVCSVEPHLKQIPAPESWFTEVSGQSIRLWPGLRHWKQSLREGRTILSITLYNVHPLWITYSFVYIRKYKTLQVTYFWSALNFILLTLRLSLLRSFLTISSILSSAAPFSRKSETTFWRSSDQSLWVNSWFYRALF